MVKYNCGCIGFAPNEKGDALIVYSCDNEEPYGIGYLDFSVEPFEPLPHEQVERVLRELNRLVSQGYILRSIRSMLRDPFGD